MDFGKALSVLLHAVDIKIKENNEDTPPLSFAFDIESSPSFYYYYFT